MNKILKMLIGLLVLGTMACTQEDDILHTTEPQDNLLQIPLFSRAALAPTATIVGLNAQGYTQFGWNLYDPKPEEENNFWESSTASPSLDGISSLACLVPQTQTVEGSGTVVVSPQGNDVLQWGWVSAADKMNDRYYFHLENKLATICVTVDKKIPELMVKCRKTGILKLTSGEWNATSLNNVPVGNKMQQEGDCYVYSFSAIPQSFKKGDVLLEYTVSTTAYDYIYSFKADNDYELLAGKTLHIHAYGDCWSKRTVANTIPVSGVSIALKSVELEVGKTEKLAVTVSPSNATNKNVSWTSSDPTIATVAADGTVTAVKSGVITVTAKSHNGKNASCQVIVSSSIENWEEEEGSGTLN